MYSVRLMTDDQLRHFIGKKQREMAELREQHDMLVAELVRRGLCPPDKKEP